VDDMQVTEASALLERVVVRRGEWRHIGVRLGPQKEIVGIVTGSPAATAGLLPGDILAKLDGDAISLWSRESLREALAKSSCDEIVLQVLRGADAALLGLTGSSKNAEDFEGPSGKTRLVKLRMGKDRTAGMRIQGNTILEVFRGSAAEKARIQIGDVVEAWDGIPIDSSFTLKHAMAELFSLTSFLLLRRPTADDDQSSVVSQMTDLSCCTLPVSLKEVRLKLNAGCKAGIKVQGNQIIEVFPGSPAEAAGLRAADRIETWNSEALTPTFSLKDAVSSLGGHRSENAGNEEVLMLVRRNLCHSEAASEANTLESSCGPIRALPVDGSLGPAVLHAGSSLHRVPRLCDGLCKILEEEQVLNIPLVVDGEQRVGMRVKGNGVIEVFPDSVAARAGIHSGDIVERWGEREINESFTIKEALSATLQKAANSDSVQKPRLIVRRPPGKLV